MTELREVEKVAIPVPVVAEVRFLGPGGQRRGGGASLVHGIAAE